MELEKFRQAARLARKTRRAPTRGVSRCRPKRARALVDEVAAGISAAKAVSDNDRDDGKVGSPLVTTLLAGHDAPASPNKSEEQVKEWAVKFGGRLAWGP